MSKQKVSPFFRFRGRSLISLVLIVVLLTGMVSAAGMGQFRDLKGYESNGAIRWVLDEELFLGVQPDRFDPDGSMTRAMFVTVLARMAKLQGKTLGDHPSAGFSDVPDGAWYEDELNWAVSKGLILGYPDGSFHPNEAIDRQMICVILVRFLEQLMGCNLSQYTGKGPSDAAEWARDSVSVCLRLKLAAWEQKESVVSRAEMADILYQTNSYLKSLNKPSASQTSSGFVPKPQPDPKPELQEFGLFHLEFDTLEEVQTWSSNEQDSRCFEALVGEDQTVDHYGIWIPRTCTSPLEIYTHLFKVTADHYEDLRLTLECIRIEGNDPEITMDVAYSTDYGETWSTKSITMTEVVTEEPAGSSGGTTFTNVIRYTSENLAQLAEGEVLTSFRLMPYDKIYSVGAFRLLSADLSGWAYETPVTEMPDLDPTRNDTPAIQQMIDTAAASGKTEVTIPSVNPADGRSIWQIGTAIVLPSNMTVYVDNCTLRLNDGALCNMFCTKDIYASSMGQADELENIKIIGLGTAVLDGGKHNGITEKTASNTEGFSQVRYNTSIHFRNVNGFTVKNLTIKEPRYWGMTFIFCRNGSIEDITFDCSNGAPNQDGIDLRIGCNHIDIKNIYGDTGDDTVALTALSSTGGSDLYFKVDGKDTDIHDVTMENIRARCTGGHGVIRLLAQNGNKIYNVSMKDIYDLSLDKGGPRCQGLLRIGDTGYTGTGAGMQYGDITGVTIDGVTSRAKYAVYIGNSNVTSKHVSYANVVAKEGEITNLVVEQDPIPAPETPVTGTSVVCFHGGKQHPFTTNTTRILSSQGTFQGNTTDSSVFALGYTNNKPLHVITPAITVEESSYSALYASITAYVIDSDKTLDNLELYYSTDNGTTWSTAGLSVSKEDLGKVWVKADGTACTAYRFYSEELLAKAKA